MKQFCQSGLLISYEPANDTGADADNHLEDGLSVLFSSNRPDVRERVRPDTEVLSHSTSQRMAFVLSEAKASLSESA